MLFPRWVLAVAAGLAFGLLPGTAIAWLAALTSESLLFALARGVAHAAVQRRLSGRLRAWEAWISDRGFLAVLAGRLSMVLPTGAVTVASALSRVRYAAFLAGTALGILPGMLAYVFLGTVAWHPRSPRFLVAFGVLATVMLVGLATRGRLRRAVA